MSKLQTIEVPYIPNLDGKVNSPKWFTEHVTDFGDMANIADFELHEIIGERLVYFPEDNEWIDLGWKAIYKRQPQTPTNEEGKVI